MPKLGSDTLTGKSGTTYSFNVYDGNMRFNDFIPGVYVICRDDGKQHAPIYVDHSDNVDIALQNHERQSCFDEHDYNRIYFHRNASLEVRASIVADLLPVLDPTCNQ